MEEKQSKKPCTEAELKEAIRKEQEKRLQDELLINNIYQVLTKEGCTVARSDWILEKVRQAVHENAVILVGEVKLRPIADGVKVLPHTKS